MVEEVIKYIMNAIYLTEVNNTIMDYGKTEFEVAKSSTKDEFLVKQGIEDDSIMKSLGIFAISVGLILLIVLIYFMFKWFAFCGKIRTIV